MPILAVPYLLPFAEAAGIAIAGLGLMEISKQVQKFMDINPEETFQILRMIMPQEGIAAMFEQLFNKEADEGEVEEDLTQLSGKEKGKKMKEEAQKKKGSYQSPEATGSYASKRGRMIGMAEKLGLADKKLKDEPYDKSKKYQGYKRFIRGRTGRKADGGIMDVL
jgi:hypothetical protein